MYCSKNGFVGRRFHINGIELFCSYSKIRLVNFKGMDKKVFNFTLKGM